MSAPYCHLETLRASYLQDQTLFLFLQPEPDCPSQMWGAVQHVCFDRHHIQNTAPLSDPHPAWTLKVDPPAPTMLRAAHQVRANGAAATLWLKIPATPTPLVEDQAAFQSPQVPTQRLPLFKTLHTKELLSGSETCFKSFKSLCRGFACSGFFQMIIVLIITIIIL